MAKGMADSPILARELVGVKMSSEKLLVAVGDCIVVGDGSTSVKREGGSLRFSLFQIPVPQGKEVLVG